MRVYITREIPSGPLKKFDSAGIKYDVYSGDTPIGRDELIENVKSADGLISLLTDNIDKDIIDNATSLKVIANYAVGYNNIDIKEADRRGIWVTNTPDVLTDATADLTIALLLAVSRRIVEGDAFTRMGRYQGWAPLLMLGTELKGKTFGIIGMGRIGYAVAERAKAFGLEIVYYSRNRKHDIEKKLGAKYMEIDTLLKESDFVSIHTSYSDSLYHFIDSKKLDMMKDGSYLINTSRGKVIDEKALVSHLENGKLAGAGLDVYEFEPKISEGLIKLDNVVLLPHIGSATSETRTAMANMAVDNTIAVLQGKKPLTPVNSPFSE